MEGFAVLVVLVIAAGLYFLPTFVAGMRAHRQAGAIFFLNLLLGWTLLGWVAALVWASTADLDQLRLARRAAERVARRKLTPEQEFEARYVAERRVKDAPAPPLTSEEAERLREVLREHDRRREEGGE